MPQTKSSLALAASLALFGAAVAPSSASASQLSFLGIATYADPTSKGLPPNGDVYHGRPSYGGGGLVEFSLMPWLGLETGALYYQRKFADADSHMFRSPVVSVPLAMRVWFGYRFSFAFGAYGAQAVGRLRDRGMEVNYRAFSMRRFDYGGLGSVRWDFGGQSFFGVFVEARYHFGWSNFSLAPSPATAQHRDILGIFGIRVGG